MEDTNRLKVVLVEKKRTAKWLAAEIGKATATISKWYTNTTQPSLESLRDIYNALEVNFQKLLVPTHVNK